MKLKAISRLLVSSLFLSNINISSLASSWSDDGRYETLEGNNITVNDVLEEDEVDVEIEGNTLVNALKYNSVNDFFDLDGTIDNEGYIEINADGQYKNYYMKKESINVKPDTSYTFFVEVVENTLVKYDGTTGACFSFGGTYNPVQVTYFKENKYLDGGVTGNISFVLKTKESFTSELEMGDRGFVNADTSGKIKFRYMIIEGDHADRDIPYFKGMKSVGELENNTIELISRRNRENLLIGGGFETSATKDNYSDVYTNLSVDSSIDLQTLINKKLMLSVYKHTPGDGEANPSYNEKLRKRFGIHGQTIWSDSRGINTDKITYPLVLVDEDTGGEKDWNNINKTDYITEILTPPDGYDTLKRFQVSVQPFAKPSNNNDETWILKNAKLEIVESLDDKPSEWSPHLSEDTSFKHHKKKEIILSEPLRDLPDGTKDKIVKRNGQWVVERNIGEVIFDGTENWAKYSLGNNDKYSSYMVVMPVSNTHRKSDQIWLQSQVLRGLSDTLNCIGDKVYYNTIDEEGFTQGHAKEAVDNHWVICVKKSRLSTDNTNGFKEWLSDNPVTVIYKLATPVYEPLNVDVSVPLYFKSTHISNNSNIPANMKVVIDRAINNAVEAIALAEINPTSENLSNARYWTNLLRESAKKDELQDSISSIFATGDSSFDKKTVTANTDVYVRSENMLSMSLDTNSVSFEGYSGAAPMELKDVVNITINSSLPYDLNAYMPTEISNSDGSSKIDFDIFNIKESSESTYQQFEDTVNEIVLKSDCAKGNNINHKIDLKLDSNTAHKADIYKTVIRFEAIQK